MRFLMTVAMIVLTPVVAGAAVGVHHEHEWPTAEQWKLLGFTAANFAIFIYAVVWVARAPLRDFLANRRRKVIEGMAEARRLKEEAERLKREYEAKVSRLDQLRAELIEEIRAIAETDRERMLADAANAADRIRRDVDRTANSDLERAKEELRVEAARIAQERAAEEVRHRLTEDDRRRLLADFLTRVNG